MKRFQFLVMSNPVEGKEDEYNQWYSHQHLDDLLKVPGVISAQRFRRTDIQRTSGPHPWAYAAVYECEADDLQDIVAELASRGGTTLLPISDAMSKDAMACFFEPITEKKEKPR
jgi:hypothetical protein